ncbi:MAG TPA: ribonuclease P protein component, partial [Acidimicrobiales bacterium]|nr:ribonuclease P protein component [Acidimicrobiales bacterium]
GIACPPDRPAAGPARSGVLWRIRDRQTFDALRRSGTRARRGPVSVTYAPVGDAPVPRVAYAVGVRVGNAVTRNKIRRRLRAATASVVDLRPGAYLVSVAPAAATLSYEELKTQVARAMTRASTAGEGQP